MTEPTQSDQPSTAAVPVGGDLLEWVVGQYLATKIQAKHILNQNGANMVYNHGRDIAKKLGLDPATITPFPSNTRTEVTVERAPDPPPVKPPSAIGSILKSVGVGAALVSGGAGAAILAASLLQSPQADQVPEVPQQQQQQQQQPQQQQPQQQSEVGFTIR